MIELMYHPFTQALGSTVLHSLWQATLLAIILWGLSRQTNFSPNRRYWLAFGALFVQLLASLVTLAIVYEPTTNAIQEMTVFEWAAGATEAVVTAYTAGELGTIELNWMEKVYFALSLVWLLGLVFGTLRLLGGHLYLQIRFGRGGQPVPQSWMPVLDGLVKKLDQRPSLVRKVRLSGRIDSPALIGLLKPLILFPFTVVNHLEAEEVEALLAHELSHYAAKDHWWNFIQTCIEVLFYFNPAVHWIGKRIREEREFRCDQQVADLGISPLVYATALFKIEEQRLAPQLSLAARSGSLLGRIERLLRNTPNYYHMKPGLLIFLLLLVGTLFSSRAELTSLLVEEPDTEAATDLDYRSSKTCPDAALLTAQLDTLPPSQSSRQNKQMISMRRNGEDIELTKINGKITSLIIDGREVPPAEYDQHQDLIAEINRVRPPMPPAPPAPPAAPNMVIPPAPPAPPTPPAPPAPGSDVFTMSINDESMTFVIPDSDSSFTMNFENLSKLSWLGELGGLIEDAVMDGEVDPEVESNFEAAVEGWAESLFSFSRTIDDLDTLGSDFRMSIFGTENEEGPVRMEFRDEDGNVKIIEVEEGGIYEWSGGDNNARIRMEGTMEELRENLERLDIDLEEQEILLDKQSTYLFGNARSDDGPHRISYQRFLEKVKDFQNRGLIKQGEVKKFSINKERMKINGKRVDQDVFDRYVKEYNAEYGVKWSALDNFEIDVKF